MQISNAKHLLFLCFLSFVNADLGRTTWETAETRPMAQEGMNQFHKGRGVNAQNKPLRSANLLPDYSNEIEPAPLPAPKPSTHSRSLYSDYQPERQRTEDFPCETRQCIEERMAEKRRNYRRVTNDPNKLPYWVALTPEEKIRMAQEKEEEAREQSRRPKKQSKKSKDVAPKAKQQDAPKEPGRMSRFLTKLRGKTEEAAECIGQYCKELKKKKASEEPKEVAPKQPNRLYRWMSTPGKKKETAPKGQETVPEKKEPGRFSRWFKGLWRKKEATEEKQPLLNQQQQQQQQQQEECDGPACPRQKKSTTIKHAFQDAGSSLRNGFKDGSDYFMERRRLRAERRRLLQGDQNQQHSE